MGVNGNPEFVEGGTYNVVVESAEAQTSRNKATPFLDVRFTVTDGEMQGEELRYELYSSQGRREAAIRELEVLGFDAAKATAEDWGALEEFLVGKQCAVTLKTETWNEQTRLKVDRLRAKGATAEEGGALGKFAAVFGAQVRRVAKEGEETKGIPF